MSSSSSSSLPPPTRSKLALKGSCRIVSDFFEYSIHSILYQRGIYPPEDFRLVKKYGLNMLISIDEDVKNYIERIMKQLHRWIYSGVISKLVVAISSKELNEVVERWQFDLEVNQNTGLNEGDDQTTNKSNDQIQKEIQSIIRQITASVTFLPELEGEHTFNVLVYASPNCTIPSEWGDSDAKELVGGNVENVKFRSFSTDNHKVGALVTYKMLD
ncbi:hypothetical protein CANARDRAFT_197183 [[Candida] arabinofermentans NRRL YB-2248]|uniref:HORMA domain-containing protein n=1 Tax=[Candida] arabinofermentans NRRL YB-2248 TaxID=983967 RepID=A0A1E4T2Y2_9ASCO|nr:hypothetical protein CANARDRAFT_197183 [[Candida] arabinofermentans NRRL YB-2248]